MKKRKTHYGVECAVCKKRMFSMFRHDYRVCGCPNETMIDGGFDYRRYGWKSIKPRGIRWCKRDGVLPQIKDRSKFPY